MQVNLTAIQINDRQIHLTKNLLNNSNWKNRAIAEKALEVLSPPDGSPYSVEVLVFSEVDNKAGKTVFIAGLTDDDTQELWQMQGVVFATYPEADQTQLAKGFREQINLIPAAIVDHAIKTFPEDFSSLTKADSDLPKAEEILDPTNTKETKELKKPSKPANSKKETPEKEELPRDDK